VILRSEHEMKRLAVNAVLACCISPASASTHVEHPYVIQTSDDRVVFRNVSDRRLELRFTVHGANFVAQFPCEANVYLNPRGQHSYSIYPKRSSKPIDYAITVIGLSAKTMSQVAKEVSVSKPLPALPRPATPDEVATLEPLQCESK
jgi:hypothetical protein